MKHYRVNCWIHISVPFEVYAKNEKEAEQKAQSMFENIDLNSCEIGDSGYETEEINEQ